MSQALTIGFTNIKFSTSFAEEGQSMYSYYTSAAFAAEEFCKHFKEIIDL